MSVRNRHVAARSLLVATCVMLLASTGCAGSDPELLFKGIPVTGDLDAALTKAAAVVRSAAEDGAGVVGDNLQCWAVTRSVSESTIELTGTAECGPVLYPSSNPKEFWSTADLDLHGVGSGADKKSAFGAMTAGRGTHRSVGKSNLYRSDDAEPPSTTKLKVPPPPAFKGDLLELEDASDTVAAPVGLAGSSFTVKVGKLVQSATIEALVTGSGETATQRAPEGHEFVSAPMELTVQDPALVKFSVTRGDGSPEPIEVGPRNESSSELRILVEENDPLTLSVSEVDTNGKALGGTQTYDLRAGERIEQIDFWYRSNHGSDDDEVSLDIPCQYGPDGGSLFTSSPCTQQMFASWHLNYSYRSMGTDKESIVASGPDRALLVVESEQAKAQLRLPSGEVLESLTSYPGDEFGSPWVFDVPATFTAGDFLSTAFSTDPGDSGAFTAIPHSLPISVPLE